MNDAQTPSRLSPEWNDTHWRWIWLTGLIDEELDNMNPRQKAYTLGNYVYRGGHEYYGETALHYITGKQLLDDADLRPDALNDYDVIKLGKYLTQQTAERMERI